MIYEFWDIWCQTIYDQESFYRITSDAYTHLSTSERKHTEFFNIYEVWYHCMDHL